MIVEFKIYESFGHGHGESVVFSYDNLTSKQLNDIKDYKFKIGDCVYHKFYGSIWQITAIDIDKKSVEHQSNLPNNNGKYFIGEYLDNDPRYYWVKEESYLEKVPNKDLKEFELMHSAKKYNL